MTTAARGRVARRATERFMLVDRAYTEAALRAQNSGQVTDMMTAATLRRKRARVFYQSVRMEQNAVRYWRRVLRRVRERTAG